MTQKLPDAKTLFLEIVEMIPPNQWQDYLDRECAHNQKLKSRVEVLLKAHMGHDSVFDGTGLLSLAIDRPLSEQVGTEIGPYELLEELGQGGMGVVYRARQSDPLRRDVAIKIIKPGMDTREVIARFQSERQVLAMLDHPNIAKVLDAGTTKTGHPYFVMELVAGPDITSYCDEAQLTIPERLGMFVRVCEAVQHAHQRGIIHRDLKPTNVLVTQHDGRPIPKVIDFGIAKAINQEFLGTNEFTHLVQLLGTPRYMSPEQIKGDGQQVDTRSDVYSLGVVLYELLTGTSPIEKQKLNSLPFEEMQQILCEESLPKPSLRLRQMPYERLATVAASRRVDPRKLSVRISGELDWIVMKALETDKNRRYDSVTSLAKDIERFLTHKPIEAGPPSWRYRTRKFIYRNKSLFLFACLLFGFLLLSVVGSSIGLYLITQEHREAVRLQKLAESNESELRERETTIRKYLYAADMQLAFQAYNRGNLKIARSKLNAHRPQNEETDFRSFEWYYLWNLCRTSSPHIFPLHREPIYHLAFSADGNTLATAGGDNCVVLWDVMKEKEIGRLGGFSQDVNGLDFSRDGTLLATAEENRCVRIWDWKTGKERIRLTGFQKPVARVYFTTDPNLLVTTEVDWSTDKGDVRLWNLRTRICLKTIKGFRGLAIDRGAKLLAAYNVEGELSLWSLPNLQQIESWLGPDSHILCAVFGPEAQQLITGSRSGVVQCWSLKNLDEQTTLPGHDGAVRSLALSTNGKFLFSVSDDTRTRISEIDTGESLKVLTEDKGRLWSVAVSPNGQKLAIGAEDGSLIVHQVPQLALERNVLYQTSNPIVGVALSPAGDQIAVADASLRELRLIDTKDGSLNSVIVEPQGRQLFSVVYSPDGRSLWMGNATGAVHQVDRISGEVRSTIQPHTDRVKFLFISRDGRYLSMRSVINWPTDQFTHEGPGCIWDTQSQKAILQFNKNASPAHTDYELASEFLNDKAVFIRKNHSVVLQNLRSDSEPACEYLHKSYVFGVAISPEKTILATGTEDRLIHLWDLESATEWATMVGHQMPPTHLVFSPNSQTLATATNAGVIKLWHIPTQQYITDLKGPNGLVTFLKFSTDGNRLYAATISPDGGSKIIAWDVKSY